MILSSPAEQLDKVKTKFFEWVESEGGLGGLSQKISDPTKILEEIYEKVILALFTPTQDLVWQKERNEELETNIMGVFKRAVGIQAPMAYCMFCLLGFPVLFAVIAAFMDKSKEEKHQKRKLSACTGPPIVASRQSRHGGGYDDEEDEW